MKIKIIIMLLLVLLLVCSCVSGEQIVYNELSENKYNVASILDFEGKYNPHDMVLHGDYLLATDSENDCVIKIDILSGAVSQLGKTGNGEDEFLTPAGINIDKNNYIYIVDAGNKRIKVLDENYKYYKEIALGSVNFRSPFSKFNDIAIDEELNTYITVTADTRDDAKIIYISADNNEIREIDGYTGTVDAYGGNVYFANTYCFFTVDGNEVMGSGTHHIYELSDGNIMRTYKLPQDYTPVKIFVNGDGIFCSSRSFNQIGKFSLTDLSGVSVFAEEQPADVSIPFKMEFGSICEGKDGIIYFNEKNSKSIYILEET